MNNFNILLSTKKLYKLSILFALVLFFSRCATPQAVYFDVDIADTASYNLSPQGANVTIFTIVPRDSLLHNYEIISKAMAVQYETDQALDEEFIDVYFVPHNEYDINNTEYLNQLGSNSNSDLLIMLRDLKYGTPYSKTESGDYYDWVLKIFPFSATISIYDTRVNKVIKNISVENEVKLAFEDYYQYRANSASYTISSEKVNVTIGKLLAGYLSTKWETKEIMLVNYPSDKEWEKGVKQASAFEFEEAIRTWMPYTGDKKDVEKQAFAAYNIAVACQMIGDKQLALEWLKFSRSCYKFPQSTQLFYDLNK